MARNKIQFQKGLSLNEFLKEYGTEEQCFDALYALRWPDGFRTEEIKAWSQQHLLPGSTVISDGLACFNAVTEVGCAQTASSAAVDEPLWRSRNFIG